MTEQARDRRVVEKVRAVLQRAADAAILLKQLEHEIKPRGTALDVDSRES